MPNFELLTPDGKRLHRVWRVRIFEAELIACGFEKAKRPWEDCLKPLLLAKGLPEGFTLTGTPTRIEAQEGGPPDGNVIILEFE